MPYKSDWLGACATKGRTANNATNTANALACFRTIVLRAQFLLVSICGKLPLRYHSHFMGRSCTGIRFILVRNHPLPPERWNWYWTMVRREIRTFQLMQAVAGREHLLHGHLDSPDEAGSDGRHRRVGNSLNDSSTERFLAAQLERAGRFCCAAEIYSAIFGEACLSRGESGRETAPLRSCIIICPFRALCVASAVCRT